MPFETSAPSFKKRLTKYRFASEGDIHEQQNWAFLKERFSNCEKFWQLFVVPLTRRIESPPAGGHRDVRDDLLTVSFMHYSAFLHLVHAYAHLRRTEEPSSFGDFYVHLGSACDLAEDFLLRVYLIDLECRGAQSPLVQTLSKDQFLKLAGEWYDKDHAKTHAYYSSKGKPKAIYLPGRGDVLCEYIGVEAWKEYDRVARPIREYRNVVVHDVAMGALLVANGVSLVPKTSEIQRYRGLTPVFRAAGNIDLQSRHFIVMQEQMIRDLANLEVALNRLWEHPIESFTKLLWKEHNPMLLAKYNLAFIERPAPVQNA